MTRWPILALLLAVSLTGPAAAQTSTRQLAADLSAELMSPFCPGRRLVDCTSSQAYDLRDEIAGRLAAGESVDQVRADLVRQYGHEILGAPPAEGVGLLAWWLPALLASVTLGVVALTITRATQAAGMPAPAVAPGGDASRLARLDDELRDLD